MILNRLYQENDKFYMKVLIHLLLALIIVDILWLIVVMPYWTAHSGKNSYWDSLSGIHTFTIVLAFVELFLKGGMIGLIFIEYRKLYGNYITDLLQFSYSAQSFPITLSKILVLYFRK
jgi:hypothetical protein